MGKAAEFRQRLRERQPMMGTFLKTPSPIVAEVLGLSTLDCVCVDAEHAPFGPMELDGVIAAFRAADMPVVVRVRTTTAGEVLSALDCGATGIIAPHIFNADQARELVRFSHYGLGGRGYAGSSRSARYTTRPMAEHIQLSGNTTTVIAQIEDAEALENIDDIAAVEGIDCLFIGRMDLTVSLGAVTPKDQIVLDAVNKICEVGHRHGKTVGMFFPAGEVVSQWAEKEATFFLLGSDHQFLLDGAKSLASRLTDD